MPTCPMCNADADDIESHKAEVHAGAEPAPSADNTPPQEPAA